MSDPRPNPLEPLSREGERRVPEAGIDAGFRRNAREFPSAAAVQQGDAVLSYADLDSLADSFAAQVLDLADPDLSRPVLLHARRSAALVAAILGAVRAGRTFTVIDAAYPAERIRRQAAAVSPALIVEVEITPEEALGVFGQPDRIPFSFFANSDLTGRSAPCAAVGMPPNPTAYLLFTSGTTGAPKCIRTGHAPLLHFLEFYRRTFHPGADDRFSLLSGLSHDPLLRDIFAPLSCGACIVVPDEAIVRAPAELYGWLADMAITFVHTTPQMIRLISAGQGERPALTSLSHVFSGGDILSRDHCSSLRAAAPQVTVVNFYGSSETPQAMGFHVVSSLDDEPPLIPIGHGIDDVQLLVLGEDGRLAEIGETGQIGIRTHFLADGYLGDPDGTRSKFIASPFSSSPDDRIYLTGDFGHYRTDGAIIGTGRQDDQVKIRGYRVELAEVNRAVERTGLAENSAVLAHRSASGENRLVAFVVAGRAREPDSGQGFGEELRAALAAQLPAPMVPARVVRLDAIPLSPNGKVDRNALAALLDRERHEAGPSLRHDPELDEPLRILIGTIEDVLEVGIRGGDLDQSFIDLGGDSLSYVRICAAVQDALGFLPRDWAARPLREFSGLAAGAGSAGGSMWTHIELPILLRAISIALVVMNHAELDAYLPATSTLFVVSGISFGRFLAPAVRRTGRLGPTLRFIVRFGIPAMLWQLLRSARRDMLWWPDLILAGTFFQNPAHPHYTFWYIDVLAANVLMLALALKVSRRLRGFRADPSCAKNTGAEPRFTESVVLVILGCVMAAAQTHLGWWNGEVGYSSVAPFKWFWLLALGLAAAEARDTVKRTIMTLLTAAILIGAHAMSPSFDNLEVLNPFFIAAVGLLPWVSSVPLPRFIQRPVVVVASSTLFIYIVNYAVIHRIMPHMGLPPVLVLQIGLPILAGIVATRIWERVQRISTTAVAWLRGILRMDLRERS